MLSGFGSSLRIRETSSNNEDSGNETGATLANTAGGRGNVLRMAVKGSQNGSGVLASTYAQPHQSPDGMGGLHGQPQETVSAGDQSGLPITLGTADRYLIRGLSYSADNSTTRAGPFTNPWHLRDGTTDLFTLVNTRQISGISEWTAPQGANRPRRYQQDIHLLAGSHGRHTSGGGVVLYQLFGTRSNVMDSPTVPGVSIGTPTMDLSIVDNGRPLMAVFGESLNALAQNIGQTDSSFASVGGGGTNTVVSQGFLTGKDGFGYRLQGIGVDIEGSSGRVPDTPLSVSVSLHRDEGGKPGEKLFDLVSPTDLGAGHRFFEAPPGAHLDASTSYVLVWTYNSGTGHRLHRTTSDSEDSGGVTRFWISDSYYLGPDLGDLSESTGSYALQVSVYAWPWTGASSWRTASRCPRAGSTYRTAHR